MNFTVDCSSSSLPQNYPGTILKPDKCEYEIKNSLNTPRTP